MYKFRYALFLTFFWLGVFCFFILPLHFNKLAFSYRQIGFLIGSLSTGAIAGRLINAWMFDFFSIKKLVRAALLFFCLLCILMGLSTNFYNLLFFLFLFGYCVSVVDLSTPEWVFIHYPEKEFSAGYHFIQIWPALSIAIAPLIGGLIYLRGGSIHFFTVTALYFFFSFLLSFSIILPEHSKQKHLPVLSPLLFKKVNVIIYMLMFLHLLVIGTNNTFIILHLDNYQIFDNPGIFFTVSAIGISLSRISGVYLFRKSRQFIFLAPLFFLLALAQFVLPTLYSPLSILTLSLAMGFTEGFILPSLMSLISQHNPGYQRHSIAMLLIMLDVGIIAGNLFAGQAAFLLNSIVYTVMLAGVFEIINMVLVWKNKTYFQGKK